MVAVPELPADPAQYVRCLAEAGYFEAVSFTADDRQRGEQYAANAAREALRAVLGEHGRLPPRARDDGRSTGRSIRWTSRASRSSSTRPTSSTRRPGAAPPRKSRRSRLRPRPSTLQFRLVDRFGDNGLVSAMLLRPEPSEPGTFEIDTWVMSCRVFGRQLEDEVMNIAVERAARAAGAGALRADFIPTAKNGVVSGPVSDLGFASIEATADGFRPGRPAGGCTSTTIATGPPTSPAGAT